MPKSFLFKAAAAAGLLFALAFPAYPHGLDALDHQQRMRDPLEVAPTAPAPGAVVEKLIGEIHHITIDDRIAAVVVEHYALKLGDGTAVVLKNVASLGLATGDRVEASGQRNGNALFTTAVKTLREGPGHGVNQKSSGGARLDGKLALLHADQFDTGRSDF